MYLGESLVLPGVYLGEMYEAVVLSQCRFSQSLSGLVLMGQGGASVLVDHCHFTDLDVGIACFTELSGRPVRLAENIMKEVRLGSGQGWVRGGSGTG